MVQALAPRLSRESSRSWLAVALLALAPLTASGQTDAGKAATKKADAPAAKADAAKKDDKSDDAADLDPDSVIDASKMKKNESVEIFKDPNAEKALANNAKEYLYPNPRLTDADRQALKNMAGKLSTTDKALVIRGVDTMVAEFTSHTNIRGLLEIPATAKASRPNERAIEKASQFLMDLLTIARANNNQEFLGIYTPILLDRLAPLLQNHLYARLEAILLLATVGSPASIDLFTKQIADPNQTVWVKQWAARGLTNATNEGKVVLDIAKSTAADAALVALLGEDGVPWPVEVRVLEALGSIRLASTTGPRGNPDVPAAALAIVADPKAKLDVRAWAAWSVGMVPIPPSVSRYNFPLATYLIGQLAAEIGDKLAADYDKQESNFSKQNDTFRYLTGLLLYEIYPALSGEPDVGDSGLIRSKHPAAAPAKPFMSGLDDQLKNLSRAAVDLLDASPGKMKESRAALGSRVADLKKFLEKNKPAEVELFPGGPKFLADAPKVAVAPAPGR